ncbi:unnamed protein product [Clonostachys chloroleuca]|uniref:FAD-binding PCMH-type domain-containing protein n=1 Tax=Clonostachys chloroleuca TaxID=1926264 RepID=A0AA35LSN6_9HYPO|nr:unnamed protein product [Clonostachys chloroleuca]
MLRLIVLIAFLATVALCHNRRCHCRPYEPCWPSDSRWQALNNSIHGNLVAVRPVGYECHDPAFDKTACEEVTAMGRNSTWRAAHPGALQWQNWEALPAANQTCYLESHRPLPCGQGRISLYSAMVESPEHIQNVVRFARRHNVRLVIKNSGHDFSGRSSTPQSLQISTNKMKTITFFDNFMARNTHGAPVSYGSAVKIGAGVLLKDLYAAVGAKGLAVVGGLSHTVGIAGGYIQGGGHSFLGTWKGMASDNALEFELITASGDLLTVNEYQHSDLFWALRGGGGGTFGVVASVTVRTFSDVPVERASLLFQISTENGTSFWNAIREIHSHLPSLNDAGGAGYYNIVPNSPQTNGTSVSSFDMVLHFLNRTDQEVVRHLFTPLVLSLRKYVGDGVFLAVDSYSQTRELFEEYLHNGSDTTGGFIILGSRMISRDFLAREQGPSRLSMALSKLRQEPGDLIRGHVVAGGRVAHNITYTALNPAWRKTVTHISIGHGWNANATLADQKAIQANITNRELPILKSLEPGKMGAYLNEADANEVDFQTSFWGENYDRLYEVKQKWDADGLFITRLGVGSEDWDEEGFCRIG